MVSTFTASRYGVEAHTRLKHVKEERESKQEWKLNHKIVSSGVTRLGFEEQIGDEPVSPRGALCKQSMS